MVVAADMFLLDLIWRENVDSFWSRARSMVQQNSNKVKLILEFSTTVGLSGTFASRRPFTPGDHCGYELAVDSLQYSRRPGKHSKEYTKHDTIQKIKSTYGNWLRASPMLNQTEKVIADDGGKIIRLIEDSFSSLWYNRINSGMKYRMGNI